MTCASGFLIVRASFLPARFAPGNVPKGIRMSEEIKRDLKELARRAEGRVAESLLRWKYRKEGKGVPEDDRIRRESKGVTDQANRVLARRGKRVWEELKKAYRSSENGEGGTD